MGKKTKSRGCSELFSLLCFFLLLLLPSQFLCTNTHINDRLFCVCVCVGDEEQTRNVFFVYLPSCLSFPPVCISFWYRRLLLFCVEFPPALSLKAKQNKAKQKNNHSERFYSVQLDLIRCAHRIRFYLFFLKKEGSVSGALIIPVSFFTEYYIQSVIGNIQIRPSIFPIYMDGKKITFLHTVANA